MNDPFVNGVSFEQKQADQLARSFNVAFNSSLLYGGAHQTTVDNAASFHVNLSACLQGKAGLTLSVDRESVFFENWCVDTTVNKKRITGYFKKADLQSITFEAGAPREEITALIRLFGDFQGAPSAQAMKSALAAAGAAKVRLNYVTYKKVTVDEEVVDKNSLFVSPGESPRDQGARHDRELLREAAPVFPLKNLFDESKQAVDKLVSMPSEDAQDGLSSVMSAIKGLTAEVQSGEAGKHFPTAQEMIDAVCSLKRDLTLGLEVLKATGRVLVAEGPVREELGRLGRETVIRLILDEYKNGEVSVKRLSQVVRRILPDVLELKKLLPHLKQRLIGAGMALSDYLLLVKSIIGEFEGDDLVDVLSSASEEMGVSVEEVIGGIKSAPADAARLIILAAEIRKGPGADVGQLSAHLTDYVERISRKLAFQGRVPGATSDPKAAIKHFEDELLEKLRGGLQEPVMRQVRQHLERKNRGYELPKGIFDIRATMFFLDHEIKLFLRYNAPFSTLMISCVGVTANEEREHAPSVEETAAIIPGILKVSKKMLRDLDLIGVMGQISDNVPFIILPMTDEPGAQCVIARLQGTFAKAEFMHNGRNVSPKIIMTSFEFDKIKTPDSASYMRAAAAFHKMKLKTEGYGAD